ncbi:hypothetical protein [Paludibacterium denitrificans]|uniref:hypothetical protein n=1 Tax=Paludibacterium denitrificans TaxID=2675226 RepID=UPI00406BA5B9
MSNHITSSDVLFLLLGAIMILAMHAYFAFLELGTVRKKNQVNALVKILTDFAVSAIAYFFVGYTVAYGVNFFGNASELSQLNGYQLVKFFFLLTFAAAIPAIVSGGIAERAKFHPQSAATFLLVGLVYPFFEGIARNNHYGIQDALTHAFGQPFHDFAYQWSFTQWEAGSAWRPYSISAHAVAAIARKAASLRIRRPPFPSGVGRPDSDRWLVRL